MCGFGKDSISDRSLPSSCPVTAPVTQLSWMVGSGQRPGAAVPSSAGSGHD